MMKLHGPTPLVAGLLLVVLTSLVYLPTTGSGFIWDDDDYVVDNPTLRSEAGLWHIWTDLSATPQYYPLVHTSFWIEYQLWGPNPTGYHVLNILLHVLAALLLWMLLNRLRVPGAWLAAAVFALHPVQVESVAWITERKNVLSAVFYLAAALAYLRYDEEREAPRPSLPRAFYGGALGLFVLALLSKTVTATLPAALLLVFWWKGRRLDSRLILPLVPFLTLAVGFGSLTLWMEKHRVGAIGEEWGLGVADRILVAGRAVWFYLGKLAWPHPLVFVYPRWQVDSTVWWQYAFPIAFALGLLLLWKIRSKAGRGPLAAALFFTGTLVPALGFFDVYPMRYSFVADHFQYLACIGPIILLGAAWGALPGRKRWEWRTKAGIALLLPATLGGLSWQRERAFADLRTLWADTLQKNPGAWIAHHNLGLLEQKEGNYPEAIASYRRALKLKADIPETHNNLCLALQKVGEIESAIGHCREALRLWPDYPKALNNLGTVLQAQGRDGEAIPLFQKVLQQDPDDAPAHRNLASVLQSQGKLAGAESHYRRALEIDPGDSRTHNDLGNLLQLLGKLSEALQEYRRALELEPDFVEARSNLAVVLVRQGMIPEAISEYQRALEQAPDNPKTHVNLALTLRMAGRSSEALEQYREALALEESFPALSGAAWILAAHPDAGRRHPAEALRLASKALEMAGDGNPVALDTLAVALAGNGRFAEAAETARQAHQAAVAAGLQPLAQAISERLELYLRGEPYLETVPSQAGH